MDRVEKNGLKFDAGLLDFLVNEALPGTGVDAERFLADFAAILRDLAPKNRTLLARLRSRRCPDVHVEAVFASRFLSEVVVDVMRAENLDAFRALAIGVPQA